MQHYRVIVIGGGPAGLAAAIAAKKEGAEVLLIEREARLGGILKQCIHDGFGLLRFGEKLSGPEYAGRYIEEFKREGIDCRLLTFVTKMEQRPEGILVRVVNRNGITDYLGESIILATGCRERTSKQVSIHGTRPSGIFTAGCAQHFTNLLGQLPSKRCVILGSGDIGLIMARRLTLEGAVVVGVYEAKSTPSGLSRNIAQCLDDYEIPLYLSHTVTRVMGEGRLTGVEIMKVDEGMQPIPGTEQVVDCDALILSVGLIPENELAESLSVELDKRTKGPVCDNEFMTNIPGIFSCGNALHVNDLVDYVSESGTLAGRAAAHYKKRERSCLTFEVSDSVLYMVPQKLDLSGREKKVTVYFRSREILKKGAFLMELDGKPLFEKKYSFLTPPEMEQVEIDFSNCNLKAASRLKVSVKGERI